MKVTAKKVGFIYGKLRKIGAEFECSEEHFSATWMEKGEVKIPDPIITHAKLKTETKVNSCDIELPSLDFEKPVRIKKEKLTLKKS